MTIKNNTIPQTFEAVDNLTVLALGGLAAHAATVGIEHNTAALLTAEFHLLTGNPATPEVLGKQALLNAQLLLIKNTTAAAKTALEAGRAFCRLGTSTLKPVLGYRWNSDWNAAGFTAGSLAVPRVPLSMLLQFRSYLETFPARENVAQGFTAALAQAKVTAIQTTVQARDTAKGARWSVKAARDAAFQAVRKRLSGLRGELAQLLSPTDDRWYAFGFRRPADGKMPTLVTGLVLTPGGAGIVLVNWAASSLAENYRVVWRPSSGGAETEAGLFAGTQHTLTGLPSALPIIIGVTARNSTGETPATEASIVVP